MSVGREHIVETGVLEERDTVTIGSIGLIAPELSFGQLLVMSGQVLLGDPDLDDHVDILAEVG